MFYCNACAEEREWPDSMMKSYGSCEVCGKSASCNDRPSSTLPIPRKDSNDNNDNNV